MPGGGEGEPLAVAECPRRARRRAVVLACLRVVARPPGRHAELHAEREAPAIVRAQEREGGERTLVVCHRVAVRDDLRGVTGRPHREVECPRRAADGRRMEVVEGEGVERRVLAVAVRRFERRRHPMVPLDARRRQEIAVEHLAHERVGEAERSRARVLLHHADRGRGRQALERGRGRESRRRLQQRRIELPPDHRRSVEERPLVRRQRIEAAEDRVAHAVRQHEPHGVGGEGGAARREPVHDLVEEERIALGHFVQACDQGRIGRGADRARDQDLERGTVETAEQDPPAQAGQVGERVRPAARLALALRRDQEELARARFARQEGEQHERRLVGPVHVLDHHDERLVGRGALQERRDAVEELEARLGIVLHGCRLGRHVEALAERRHDLRDGRGVVGELRADRRRIVRVDVVADGADPRPIGGGPGLLRTASPEDASGGEVHAPHEFLDGARLSDAGLADDREHLRASAAGLAQPRVQGGELPVPSHERGFARGGHHLHEARLGKRGENRK